MISFKHIKLFLFLLLIPFKVLADTSVGSPVAAVDVNSNGAATYNLSFEIPNGGGFHPQIGLAYNSQSEGYGNAGYGFNITGISVITCGGRNQYYDKYVKGSTYFGNSTFSLDGKRLLLESGTAGYDGAKYTIEGDPYTTVTIHGNFSASCVDTWFEVTGQDGTTYKYGNEANSKLEFKNPDDGNTTYCAAWYITEAIDKYGNVIRYQYSYFKDDFCILPTCITYGENQVKSRGIKCQIIFTYSDIPEANRTDFYLLRKKGTISKKLSTVESSIMNSGQPKRYRKYTLGYNDNIDKSAKKYTRLTSIVECNEWGNLYNPVMIDWNALQAMSSLSSSRVDKDIPDTFSSPVYNEKNRSFFAVDINGDGISDILQQSYMEGKAGAKNDTHLYVYDSQMDKNGNVSFDWSAFSSYYSLGNNVSNGLYEVKNNGVNVADIDGDGFNDIVFQYYINPKVGDEKSRIGFQVAFGRSIENRGLTVSNSLTYNYPLDSRESTSPVSVNLDINGDGRDEMIFIENHTDNEYGKYHCGVIRVDKDRNIDGNLHDFYLYLDREPKRLYTGDYNSDGLQDLLIMFDHGHKIYYNSGFNKSYAYVFSESNSIYNKDSYLEDYQTVEQGDFNGDGYPDFVCCAKAETKLKLFINNRNGSFKQISTIDIPLSYKKSEAFSMNIVDFDNDGKSDIVYVGSWLKLNTFVCWYKSTGENFDLYKSYVSDGGISDGNWYFTGDFNGDGVAELANYGILLNAASTNFIKDKIHIYNTSSKKASAGKVSAITDGFNVKTAFTYSYATNPSVYSRITQKDKENNASYISFNNSSSTPKTEQNEKEYKGTVNYYTLPLSVVSKKTISAGNITKNTTTYSYGNLKIHTSGKGTLGFESFTKNDKTLGTVENSLITKWDTEYWVPSQTINTVTIGKKQSQTISDFSVTAKGKQNYFAYASEETSTDFDDNTTNTMTFYDTNRGVISGQRVYNDGSQNMFKYTYYTYSKKYGGTYLPDQMEMYQRHPDDNDWYYVVNTYEYDEKGNTTKIVNNAESDLKLTEYYEYDEYGNKTSEYAEGEGVNGGKEGEKNIVKKYKYDTSGRFMIDEQTVPASTHYVYKYNIYGDMYEKIDSTVPTNLLVSSYLHNRWNEVYYAEAPDCNYVEYSKVWEPTWGTGYYSITATPNNGPQTKTVYDPFGREVSTSSVGLKGVEISKETTYDSNGQVSSVVNRKGNLILSEIYTYDDRGRKTKEESSSGASTTYSYGKRTVKATSAGRTTTTEYDAWGNTIKTTDPLGTTVTYTYNSNGQPKCIKTAGNEVTFKYDDAGHRIEMVDPDAGTTTYSYGADGTLLSQTDARGVTTNYGYDYLGRLKTKTYVDKSGYKKTQTNEYFTSGKDMHRLKSQTYNGYTRTYTYDRFGKVTSESRNNFQDHACYTIKWAYNSLGQKTKVIYPGTHCDMSFDYSYDENGFLKEIKLNNSKSVYSLKSYDGLTLETNTVAGIMSKTVDKDGYPYEYKLTANKDVQNFRYDKSTGNLYMRTRLYGGAIRTNEKYKYDDMDRLVSVYDNRKKKYIMSMSYADNGNILDKSDVGQYTYDSNGKPHAVISVSNDSKNIASNTITTQIDRWNGKVKEIYVYGSAGKCEYSYGPDDEKWATYSFDRNQANGHQIDHVYIGGYEKIKIDDVITEQYFIENGVIVVSKTIGTGSPTTNVYQAVTDNLGSIVAVYDEHQKMAFGAEYDVWGKQKVYLNDINLCYGYTGHEMLPCFDLIDMGARLYDPNLGRFISCDNYVQAPDNSQNFNRYSYCLNNPLKYTDPSGNFFIIGAFVGAYINWMMNGCQFNAKGLGHFAVGAVAGAVSAGIGAGVNVAMAGGNFWTGAAGLAQGVSSTGFISGMATGASAGFAGGLISGAGNSWVAGKKFSSGLVEGLKSGGLGALSGGITGGIHGGLDALNKGTNFWTGTKLIDPKEAAFADVDFYDRIVHGKILGKYVGDFEGQHVFESKMLGTYSINGGYSGFTLPDRGIWVGKGVFTGSSMDGRAMMQHEFGHVLQCRIVGVDNYYKVIAKESFMNCGNISPYDGIPHGEFWTETWANYLAKQHFGVTWHGMEEFKNTVQSRYLYYPSKNISKELMWEKFGM